VFVVAGDPDQAAKLTKARIGAALTRAHRRDIDAEGGARLQTIMAILGHKSTAMVMIYTESPIRRSDASTRPPWPPVSASPAQPPTPCSAAR
jgi:hypothetical protein